MCLIFLILLDLSAGFFQISEASHQSEYDLYRRSRCPSHNFITRPGSHCFELGCTVGENCKTIGIENIKCCNYVWMKHHVSCCLVKSFGSELRTYIRERRRTSLSLFSKVRANPGCPPVKIPRYYHCMEVGCRLGQRCRTVGLQHQKCCRHQWHGVSLPCCLMKSPLRKSARRNFMEEESECIESEEEDTKKDEFECPPYEVPEDVSYNCLNLDCDLGSPCSGKTVQGQKCCQHMINGAAVRCCLEWFSKVSERSEVLRFPDKEVQHEIICPLYHIYIYEPCTKCHEAKDCKSGVCCRFTQYWGELRCCAG